MLVRLQQHLILDVFRHFGTFVIVCVVSLHVVSPDMLQPGILHLNGLFVQGITSEHLLEVVMLYETEPNILHSCMAFLPL